MFAPKRENAYDDDELTKVVTKEEALKILKDSEEAGLVHCTMNIQTGQNYICNCCTCCCGVLRGLTQHEQPYAFVKSDFLIEVDNDLCTGCGTCVDRCQFAALDVPEDISVVNTDRCIGCGVCAISCPEGALQLVARHGLDDCESYVQRRRPIRTDVNSAHSNKKTHALRGPQTTIE
jgi:ferredoxin